MNTIINMFKNDIPLIVMVVLLILLLILLAVRKRQEGSLDEELVALEVKYNELKSIPLTFKLNKALSLAKVNDNIKKEVSQYKESYDTTLKAISTIGSLYIDAEEALDDGDVKEVKMLIEEISDLLSITAKSVKELDTQLDGVLEQEVALRSHATDLKERFRQIKQGITNKASVLSFSEEIIDVHVVKAENQFKAFEEWMFVSEFDKADQALSTITESLNKLDEILVGVPQLLPVAQGVIPKKIANVSSLYSDVKNANIYLDHLEVTQTLKLQSEGLSEDLAELRSGEIETVREKLDHSKQVLDEMEEKLNKELMSHSEVIDRQKDIEKRIKEITDALVETNEGLSELSKNYDMSGLIEKAEEVKESAQSEIERYSEILTQFDHHTPSSEVMNILNEFNKDLSGVYSRVLKMHQNVETIIEDEKRAREHLLKLQLIINEVQVKINEYRLPSISSDYKEDVKIANEHIRNLEAQLNEKYLDLSLLNATLADAIDYVYKLYNNVNNIVGMAIMVENALVFANRYRSTYEDIDSELTRSELAFRNGEYTQALTIVLEVIEKLHPTNYEELIKENAANVI